MTVIVSLALIVGAGLAVAWIGAVGTTRYADDSTCPAAGSGTLASPYCRIQDAICASVSGDTVSVAPGTYPESLRMKPGVSVISQGGAAVTTINASGQPCTDLNYCTKLAVNRCSVVLFGSGHTTATRLEGFTLTGGAGREQASPAHVAGGGIFVFSSATIVNNVITNNVLTGPKSDYKGGGVYVALGAPVISNNTISGNRAVPPAGTSGSVTYGYGGGIFIGFLSDPIITSNIISGNRAGDPNTAYSLGGGGGIAVWPGDANHPGPRIDRNLIADNITDSLGGGVGLNSLPNTMALAVVTNNVIVGNSAKNGGGVYTYFNRSNTINNTITGNTAFLGAGMFSGQSDTTLPVNITNNIIEGNRLMQFGNGGGLYTFDLSTTFDPAILNNEFWDNDRNHVSGDKTDATVIGVNGNLAANPLFVNKPARDYQLDPNSPAIDRASAALAPPVDKDNFPRGFDGNGIPNNPVAGDIDIGAYEKHGACVPAAEVCDNLDNDCNGQTDEGLGSSTCGVGSCQRTVQNCTGGVTQTCTPGSPTTEVCDNLDNNCDGQIDESLGSTTCGVGSCQRIVQNCVGGAAQTCTPGSPTTEVCDNIDNNCNGQTDESLGSTTCGVGFCQQTVQNCLGGATQTCTPGSPATEVCDSIDNNCNGSTDEGLGSTTCGVGACERTVQNCSAGSTQTCTPGSPATEVCDGIDNNCSGAADEGFPDTDLDSTADCLDLDDDNDGTADLSDCRPLDPTAFGLPAEVGNLDVAGIGPSFITYDTQSIGSGTRYEILSGLVSRVVRVGGFSEDFCIAANSNNGAWQDTRPAPPAEQAWYYMIRSKNACGNGTLGTPASDQPRGANPCQNGIVDMDNDGSPSDLDCNESDPAQSPLAPEVCDSIDNDCDNVADDGNPGGGAECGSSVGECSPGATTCASGSITCVGGVGPVAESCDGLDNNCDALVDNGFPDTDGDAQADCIDPDDDNDGTLDASDCAPQDAAAFGLPLEVEDLDVLGGTIASITWVEQAIGSGTQYDLASGQIVASGAVDFPAAVCLGSTSASPATDPRSGDPAPDTVWFYLVKSRNGCGPGTFGSSERDTIPSCP